MYKLLLRRAFAHAHAHNVRNIISLAKSYGSNVATVCDVGAGDGFTTSEIVSSIGCAQVYAIESDRSRRLDLERRGYTVVPDDLNGRTTLPDCCVDLVVSNQVFEHLYDTDMFLAETFRILKPGGIAVISTENIASWHNIAALLIGWQPFSLTNISSTNGGIGNPLAFFAGDRGNCFPMQHHRLVTPRALQQLMTSHGFTRTRRAGAGYYPFPAVMGKLDPAHAHFIAVSGQKPECR